MNFIINETAQKLRGGYYTPLPLAQFILKWAVQGEGARVLEPSCGDGAFFDAAGAVFAAGTQRYHGFELDPEEAAKAVLALGRNTLDGTVQSMDFLDWYLHNGKSAGEFDAVVGNPPFIRYQYMPESLQTVSERIFDSLGLKFTKHTNAWIPFVLAGIDLLRPGGRLGMVVPTEVFNVIYAQGLRSYLGETCSEITIVDPEDIWFKDTLQGAVLLLATKKVDSNRTTEGLGIFRTSGLEFSSKDPKSLFAGISRINGHTLEGKWTNAFLTKKEFGLYQEIKLSKEVFRFDEIASVDVGIVTGANDFFLVDEATIQKYHLEDFAHPMFGRSDHCPGVIYSNAVHAKNIAKGLPTAFVWIRADHKPFNSAQMSYIKLGELQELHTRYKCRIREPWYSVPSVYSTEVGMLKRSHDLPRLIHNEINAYTTDTAYRVKTTKVDPKALVYSFINSLTALSAELEGRSYGGGVLELVPSEINKLLIPKVLPTSPVLADLDKLVGSREPEKYLPDQDRIVLGNIGLSQTEQTTIFDAWRKLKNRRQRRA